MAFVFNPPTRKGRRKSATRKRRAASKSASNWRAMVKKYGVAGAAAKRKAAKKAAAKRKRTRKTTKTKSVKKRVTRSRKRVRRNPVARKKRRSTRRKRKSYAKNPRKTRKTRKTRRRSYRRNAWKGQPRKHSKAAKLGWRRRKRRKTTTRKRRKTVRRRKTYSHRRYVRRRGKPRGTAKQVRARRRNIRKALNKRYGRKWTKHSRAKWNPGTSLSLGGFSRSMSQAFSLNMLKDGLSVAGGMVGALALPAVVQRILPSAVTSRVSLVSGWTGYIANFASAGIVGYLAGLALGPSRGRLVLYGGLGGAMAKLLLDKVPMLSAKTGVTLSGNSELDRLVEQEIAAQLATGSNMGAYLNPAQVGGAEQLGDYVTPGQVVRSEQLGGIYDYPEFGAYDSGVEFPV